MHWSFSCPAPPFPGPPPGAAPTGVPGGHSARGAPTKSVAPAHSCLLPLQKALARAPAPGSKQGSTPGCRIAVSPPPCALKVLRGPISPAGLAVAQPRRRRPLDRSGDRKLPHRADAGLHCLPMECGEIPDLSGAIRGQQTSSELGGWRCRLGARRRRHGGSR